MLLKKICCIVSLLSVLYGESATTSQLTSYVHKNLQQLNNLVRKKKLAKSDFQLDTLFDEYVEDAKKLLQSCDQQNISDQQSIAKDDTVKQIAHYMAVLQKLLAIMNNSDSKPLEFFCLHQRSDEMWGTLCGDRPAKRVIKYDEQLRNNTPHWAQKASSNDFEETQMVKGH